MEKFQLRNIGCGADRKRRQTCPKKQDSIQPMSPMTNKDEVRRVLGVVTYLSRFSEDLSTKSDPLSTLLNKDTTFIWETNEQNTFDEIKALISNAPMLRYFNPNETTEVSVDASSSN